MFRQLTGRGIITSCCRRWTTVVAISACLASTGGAVAGNDAAEHAQGQGVQHAPGQDKPKKQRHTPQKPGHTVLDEYAQPSVLTVKFREGTRVRHRDGQLVTEVDESSDAETERLGHANLDHATVKSQMKLIKQLLEGNPRQYVKRLFSAAEDQLDQQRDEAEPNSDEELADLNLYFRVYFDGAQPAESGALIDALNALDIVEIAYAEPILDDAGIDIFPPTPSYTSWQGYLDPAPTGIDARMMWERLNAKGAGIRVIDVEQDWDLAHEDLNPAFYVDPYRTGQIHHGTAVLGILAAAENSYGITGIAPLCQTGVSSVKHRVCWGTRYKWVCTDVYDFANAFSNASARLSAGDFILIEQHTKGPSSSQTCACNCGQFEYVPMEYYQANYDVIKSATSRGIVVVEAAGNGSMDLDSSIYGGRFDRSVRDSGAILVGAGTPWGGRAPECWTNYGSRVDVQGWGDNVASLGYGDLAMVSLKDPRQWYSWFGGTSSAAPIVAGAGILIQGWRKASGMPVLNSLQMRDLLAGTGTPQAASTKHIGPLPDLVRILSAHGLGVHQVPTSITPTTAWQRATGYIAPNAFRRYSFEARAGRWYEFGTIWDSNPDTIIEVWRGSSRLARSDDYDGWKQSYLVWRAPGTGDYIVVVTNKGTAGSYNGNLTMWYRMRNWLWP